MDNCTAHSVDTVPTLPDTNETIFVGRLIWLS